MSPFAFVTPMRLRQLAPAAALLPLLAAAGCTPDKALSVQPTNVVAAPVAVTDAVSAGAAVAGMYTALQDASYYSTDFTVLGDLSGDNTRHSGTFITYRQADQNNLLADNGTIAGVWRAIYGGINRANSVLARLPGTTAYLDDATRNQYAGEALFLRALGHHNATKLWGAVPVVLTPINVPADAGNVVTADTAAVYRQILADLDSAEQVIGGVQQTRRASLGAIRALRTRVRLYRRDWAGTVAAAQSVAALGYRLAPSYATLFTATGSDTPEDILRLQYNDQNTNSLSFYFYPGALGGRREVAPDASLRTAYPAGDARLAYNIGVTGGGTVYGSKYRSITGTENPHVIRYAEVLLAQAEALARLGRLAEAVVPLNLVRARAGVAAYVVGTGAAAQQELVDAVIAERRLELAFEGDRWPDMVRTGLAATFLAAKGAAPFQVLYPIPQRDRDTAPGLTQNPGY